MNQEKLTNKETVEFLRSIYPDETFWSAAHVGWFRVWLILATILSIFCGPIAWIFWTPAIVRGFNNMNKYMKVFKQVKNASNSMRHEMALYAEAENLTFEQQVEQNADYLRSIEDNN